MEKQKLLIADSNEEFCKALKAALAEEFTVQTVHTGDEAVNMLDSFCPELLVLDVVLSGLDGIRVLEYARRGGHTLEVLVTTSCRSDFTLNRLAQLEVSYVLLKPCQLQVVAERVREIAAQCVRIQPKRETGELSAELLRLGMNPKHNGYHYLGTAVEVYMRDPAQSLTKELYVAVGAVYGVHWQQVERSIRTAVEYAWNRRDEQLWRQYFPFGSSLKRPANGEVICALAEQLLLEKARRFG